MHPLPPQRQGHPRCVNCNHCTEQGSPDWASLFRVLGAFVPLRMQSASPAPARGRASAEHFSPGAQSARKGADRNAAFKKEMRLRVCVAQAPQSKQKFVCVG